MDASYRAGMNRGSADKLARRPFDDAAPPKHRTTDTARRSYKKGYKAGYDKTRVPVTSGDSTGGIPSQADLMNMIMGKAGDLEKYASDVGAYVDKAGEYYKTVMGIIGDAKKFPGSSYVLDFGKIEKKIKEVASGIYQKAMDLGAPSEVLKKIEYMASPEQLAVSSAPPPAAEPAAPPAAAPPPAQKRVVAPMLGGRLALLSTVKAETQVAKERRAQEIAAKREAEKAAAASATAQDLPPGNMAPMNMPGTYGPGMDPGMPGTMVMSRTDALPGTTADAQKKDEKPSWFSQNWYWVAGGAVLVAGGGYLYYRSSKSPEA